MIENDLTVYPFLHTFNQKQEINSTFISERLSRAPHDLYTPHRIDFNLIIWVQKGKGNHFIDFKPVAVEPGMLLFISKGKVHSFDPEGDYDGPTIIFTDSFFCRTESDLEFLYYSRIFNDPLEVSYRHAPESEAFFSLRFGEIVQELRKPYDVYQHSILYSLLNTLLLFAEREKQSGLVITKDDIARDLDLMIRFKQLLKVHLNKRMMVKDYASLLNITERKLQLVTRKILGKTPKELMDERLVLDAKRMLTVKSVLIKDVSVHTGFTEVTNFIKFFRKMTGLTPNQFRSSVLKSD